MTLLLCLRRALCSSDFVKDKTMTNMVILVRCYGFLVIYFARCHVVTKQVNPECLQFTDEMDKLMYECTKDLLLNSRPESVVGFCIFLPDQKP